MRPFPLVSSLTPRRAAQLFALSNIAFLGVDIALAHLANDFARWAEWAPVGFSAVAAALLVPGALGSRRALVRWLDVAVGCGAIVVGLAGMIFHLQSGFFAHRTLHDLVYAAPFVAPVSYVGVGLLVLLLRSEDADGRAFGPWVLCLTLGGFLGNFFLSVLDHAQNGFFHATEWIPVASAAFAVSFLALSLALPRSLPLLACAVVLALQAATGLLGFGLHVVANLRRPAASLLERFVFGAPAFAPLLFVDLALLGAIGLWASHAHVPQSAAAASHVERA